MDRLQGTYKRLENPNATVIPAEVVILLRDLHQRIKELEDGIKQEKPTPTRRGTNKVSSGEVSSS